MPCYNIYVPKKRLDTIMVERGLVKSRAFAQRLVMAGEVRIDGQVALKPSLQVFEDAQIEIEQGEPFISRGGEKLEAALDAFQIEVAQFVCADVGASTGGFTDCLLQHGAARVYAIDVGKGILHWKLRQDARVMVMEEVNARYVEHLPEPIDLVTIDVSFISLRIILPVVKAWFLSGKVNPGKIIALIKPQFEAGRAAAAHGQGVIRDPQIHRQVLLDVLEFSQKEGFGTRGLMRSPITGPKGNIEFLAYWIYPGDSASLEAMITPLFDF